VQPHLFQHAVHQLHMGAAEALRQTRLHSGGKCFQHAVQDVALGGAEVHHRHVVRHGHGGCAWGTQCTAGNAEEQAEVWVDGDYPVPKRQHAVRMRSGGARVWVRVQHLHPGVHRG
jgi:hypothetical protein